MQFQSLHGHWYLVRLSSLCCFLSLVIAWKAPLMSHHWCTAGSIDLHSLCIVKDTRKHLCSRYTLCFRPMSRLMILVLHNDKLHSWQCSLQDINIQLLAFPWLNLERPFFPLVAGSLTLAPILFTTYLYVGLKCNVRLLRVTSKPSYKFDYLLGACVQAPLLL